MTDKTAQENFIKFDFGPITNEDRVVQIDLGGTPCKCLMVDDVAMFLNKWEHHVPDIRKQVPCIRHMEMDSDDTVICAFAKSGTHWIWEIISMLKKGKAEYQTVTKVNAMLDMAMPEDLRKLPIPRVYNTHYTFHHLPQQVMEKKCKIVLLQRNPKDVIVSALPYLQGLHVLDKGLQWDEFFEKYMELDVDCSLLNWFYYTNSWSDILKDNHDNIHSLTYEDLKEDPIREIQKLAKFLEIDENMQLFRDIATKCTFKNLKEAAQSKASTTKVGQSFDFIFRKGEVGDWKNYFTVAQNEKFASIYAERMKDRDFKFRYTL